MTRNRDQSRLATDGADIIPYTSDRNIRQKMSDILTPADFGIVGDGTIDETVKLQAAANASSSTGKPFLMPAKIKHGAITLPAGASLIGVDGKTVVTAITGTYTLYNITGSDATIKNLKLQCASKSGGSEINIACGTGTIERTTLGNIVSFGGTGGLTDSGSGSGIHISTRVNFVQFRGHRGTGLSWTRGFAFLFVEKFTADYVGTTTNAFGISCDFSGVPGSDAGGLFFKDCDVLGVPTQANQRGFHIKSVKAITIQSCRADSCGEIGFNFDTVNKLTLNNPVSSLCNAEGFAFTNVTNFNASNIEAFGRNALSGLAAKDGLRFISGCGDGTIEGGTIRDFTGNGVSKVAAQTGPIRLGGLYIATNTGRGVKTVGNSAFTVNTSTIANNVAGNFDLGGTSDFVVMCQFTSGGVNTYGPGPVTG